MRKVLKTILVAMLALGLMGIILGISVGLYRNDVLAKTQAAEESVYLSDEQSTLEQFRNDDPGSSEIQIRQNTLMELLLWGNLHTIFLGIGTLLTIISLILLLVGLKNSTQRIIRQ